MLYLDFGKAQHRVFPSNAGISSDIEEALHVRGWSDIVSGETSDGWMENGEGVAVYKALGLHESMFFLSASQEAVDKVIEAIETFRPGATLRRTLLVSPE